MNLLLSMLPKVISTSITEEAKIMFGVITLPYALSVRKSDKFSYYIRGQHNHYGAVIFVDLNSGQHYTEWGSLHGDFHNDRPGNVNSNKTERDVAKDHAVIKLSFSAMNRNLPPTGEIIFHPDVPLPKVQELELSKRERTILFPFGLFSSSTNIKEALARLDVTKTEIDNLVKKNALVPTRKGYKLTVSGLCARSNPPNNFYW